MNFLNDVITYARRIVKTPSDAVISDNLIIDYINRFWLMDVDARMQLFDLKVKYLFETIPGLTDYNMPLYIVQTEPGSQQIAPFPVYQGFIGPGYINGIQVPFYTERTSFWNVWPNYLQSVVQVATGDGTTTTFQFNLPYFPSIPGHVDITGIISQGSGEDPIFANNMPLNASGNIDIPSTSFYPGVFITYTNANGSNTTITDSGIFLENATGNTLYGLLMEPGQPPFGNTALSSPMSIPNSYSMTVNTVNYSTGQVNVTFPSAPPAGVPIQVQSYYFEQGLPRAVLFYNNTLTLRPPPNIQYTVELDAYLTPAAFLTTTQALPFAYMAEYLARGAARKILSDTGDWEQFAYYEPLFREQENLVWKRSQRQWTATRTPTIFSDLAGQSPNMNIGQGGGT